MIIMTGKWRSKDHGDGPRGLFLFAGSKAQRAKKPMAKCKINLT